MKPKMYALLLGVTALLAFHRANAFTVLTIIAPSTATTIKDPNPLSFITARQFLTLTPQKFQELTGKRMNLIQKLEIKMLQHKVKKIVKTGEVFTMADVQKKIENLNSMNVLG